MKHLAYTFKEFLKALYAYPQIKINPDQTSNYDVYWIEKRGKNIGDLSSWQKERADYILKKLAEAPSEIMLADVGCGDGSILNYLKQNSAKGIKCIGYDSSAFALEQARKFGVDTKQINISDTNSFGNFVEADFYLLLETLEHVPHSEILLQKAIHASQQGVFFSFPNTGYLTHRLRLLFGKVPLQWRILPNEHVRFWTYSDLKWWLSALEIEHYEINCYKGIPFLNKILPSIFAAGFVVYITK